MKLKIKIVHRPASANAIETRAIGWTFFYEYESNGIRRIITPSSVAAGAKCTLCTACGLMKEFTICGST